MRLSLALDPHFTSISFGKKDLESENSDYSWVLKPNQNPIKAIIPIQPLATKIEIRTRKNLVRSYDHHYIFIRFLFFKENQSKPVV